MDLSVLIPTHARPEAIARCVGALATQETGGARVEVLVGIDGPDQGERDALAPMARALDLRVLEGERRGPAATRNRLLAAARSPLTLLLNDDVVPRPGLLLGHLGAHRALERPALVLGDAPFARRDGESLFDRLIRESSMVFFYDQMNADDPARDWGFRHAWTLNLSLPTSIVREVGGFCESLPGAAYEDIELAWRLRQRYGAPVLYRPGARVVHEHAYTPAAYLAREEALGRDAGALARANPACALELFGRDVCSEDEIAYAREYVERECATAQRLRRTFDGLADMPGSSASAFMVRVLYEHHLALKRWHWRVGRVEGAQAASPPA